MSERSVREKIAGAALVGLITFGGAEIYATATDSWWHSKNATLESASSTVPNVNTVTNSGIKTEMEPWGYDDYKNKGTEYRRRIKILMETNPEEGKRLQGKYNILFKVTEGKEYLDGGEEFVPKPGDRFKIDDPSEQNPGVFLRPTATSFGNVSQTRLFDGATVIIMGDSTKFFDDFYNREEIMWPITVESDSPYWETDYESQKGETGFVSQRFLGNRAEENSANRQ